MTEQQPTPLRWGLRDRIIAALDNAHHTHPCPVTGSPYWTGCFHPDGTSSSCHSERRADAVLAVLPEPSTDRIEEYLRFLRGQGSEPDLSALPQEQRAVVEGQFEIVRALADRDSELPPLDRDPVAQRLGLVPTPADRGAYAQGIRDAIAELKRDALGVIPRLERMADEAQPANHRARAAVLEEAAQVADDLSMQVEQDMKRREVGPLTALQDLADELRRLAADAQPPAAPEAHPPRHRWQVETRDPLANEWAPGSRFTDRAEAVERYQAVSTNYPRWNDGTPVDRRFVRETTSFTVEEPQP